MLQPKKAKNNIRGVTFWIEGFKFLFWNKLESEQKIIKETLNIENIQYVHLLKKSPEGWETDFKARYGSWTENVVYPRGIFLYLF